MEIQKHWLQENNFLFLFKLGESGSSGATVDLGTITLCQKC